MRDTWMDIRDPAAWKLLMSPVRVEIAEGLRTLGPCSIPEVAELIDRPADALYRHVALLQEAGFVVDAGFRRSGRHTERLFDVAADDFRPAFDPSSGEDATDAIVHTTETVLACTRRVVREAAAQRAIRLGDADRNLAVSYELSWLRDEDFARVRELLRELKQIMDEGKRRREGRPFLALSVVTLVARKRGSSRRSRASGTPTDPATEDQPPQHKAAAARTTSPTPQAQAQRRQPRTARR